MLSDANLSPQNLEEMGTSQFGALLNGSGTNPVDSGPNLDDQPISNEAARSYIDVVPHSDLGRVL